jgi:NAD(P)-dependent dehydrogenase (short-subunit alcohol dehydrogenase family)
VAVASEVEALAGAVEEAYGAADLVINNAGVAVAGPVGEVPLADWQWIIGVNLMGVVHGCHVFAPRFKKRGGGHIINVASAAGLISAPHMAPYNATKAGVVALSETMAVELAGTGVVVTVLCPTFFQTNIARAGRTYTDVVPTEDIEKLMRRGTLQAPEVAAFALEAADAGELYALPHADGRWMWRLKRLAPQVFQGFIVPQAAATIARKRAKR